MNFERLAEHKWLTQLVGDWEVTTTMPNAEPMPPGTETVRSVGDFWVLAEGRGSMPDGSPAMTCLTLGYDPRMRHFVGTWLGSMLPHLFVYQGTLDAAANRLVLDCQGPDFSDPTRAASYREVVTIVDDTRRTFVSYLESPEGDWVEIMHADYRRV
ncbi:DUF1579 domain-containing protein [Amorphus orientalis]|uniref:DUF1579 domain-containing protein n=1 Tax=Amorphus orientalis TaxID=649198 RepID=A0AAE3VQE4_9HYPH|nr:DUF1579 domain-containing protein [Amorphus orientalis]MDQ0315940.1 hypothetical protein [Amorphus orientalis]